MGDKETKEIVGNFWTGHKKFPSPADIDAAGCIDYLYASSQLLAFVFGVKYCAKITRAQFIGKLKALNLKVPQWTEPKNLEIETDENVTNEEKEESKVDDG